MTLNVGIIIDSWRVPEEVRDLLLWARDRSDVRVTHAILQRTPALTRAHSGRSGMARLLSGVREKGMRAAVRLVAWELLGRLEALRLRRAGGFSGFLESHDVSGFGLTPIEVKIRVSPSGLVYRYPPDAIAAISASGCDVLIRYGSGILRGEALNCVRFGVLSFHHGDNRINRGGPSGFWEVARREDFTGFVLQRLTSELDGGEVLFRGCLPTRTYFMLNRAKLIRKASVFMQHMLARIAASRRLPEVLEASPYTHRLYRLPGLRAQGCYFWQAYVQAGARALLRRLMGRMPRWHVAFLEQDNWRTAVLHRAHTVPNPPDGFLADPFLTEIGGSPVLLVEEWSNRRKKAHIAAYGYMRGSGFNRLGAAIEEPFHLAFPFPFRFKDALYCCPETSGGDEIRLYRCNGGPLDWSFHSVLMTGISAADSMVFEHSGRWWLLTNIDSARLGDRSELHIFHAPDPIAGPWTPHLANPVYVDASHSRNGGLIREGDRLFRVAQGYRFGSYGDHATIREIVELDESRFAERKVGELRPEFFDHTYGIHHFHAHGGLIVFDHFSRSRAASPPRGGN